MTESRSGVPDDIFAILGTISGARLSMFPASVNPMLATLCESTTSQDGWICEPKMDGIRGICLIRDKSARILSRRGLDLTPQYPVLAAHLAEMFPFDVALDGEIVALDNFGKPSFQLLQQRMNLSKHADVMKAEKQVPVTYFLFDILQLADYSLISVPLRERKMILKAIVPESPQVKLLHAFDGDVELAFETCVGMGFEGIVAKRLESQYEFGRRSPSWLKIKAQRADEFVVGGYTLGTGARAKTFGALLLGQYDNKGQLIYSGSVGSGFDGALLERVMQLLVPTVQQKCTFLKRPDEKKQIVWVEPKTVIEVKFMDWTRDRHLRSPVFLRFRPDKAPDEVQVVPTLEKLPHAPVANKEIPTNDEILSVLQQLSDASQSMQLLVEGEKIKLTNLERPFWGVSESGPAISKRDYLTFLAKLSPFLLPQLHSRPLTCVRATSGVHKSKWFFQKKWDQTLPECVDLVRTKDAAGDVIEYVTCNSLASLLFFAQHSVVEFHCFPSRMISTPDLDSDERSADELLDYPDFLIFDLDSHGETIGGAQEQSKKVCEAALLLREICQSLSLQPIVKTSGKTGLHVLIPIQRNLDFDMVRALAQTMGQFLVKRSGDSFTQSAVAAKKSGQILVDHSPNGKGKTIVVPYSPRATLHASISTPVTWAEIEAHNVSGYTMHSLLDRLGGVGDIWGEMHSLKVDLNIILSSISRK